MKVTRKDVDEFKQIYKKETGRDLPEADAWQIVNHYFSGLEEIVAMEDYEFRIMDQVKNPMPELSAPISRKKRRKKKDQDAKKAIRRLVRELKKQGVKIDVGKILS